MSDSGRGQNCLYKAVECKSELVSISSVHDRWLQIHHLDGTSLMPISSGNVNVLTFTCFCLACWIVKFGSPRARFTSFLRSGLVSRPPQCV